MRNQLSRRAFLQATGVTSATLLLAACVAPGAAPAQEASAEAPQRRWLGSFGSWSPKGRRWRRSTNF